MRLLFNIVLLSATEIILWLTELTAFHRYMIIQAFYRIKANSYILLSLPQAITEINQRLEEKEVQKGLNYRGLGWESAHASHQ